MRTPIDITKKKQVELALDCPVCKKPAAPIQPKTNTLIWYCKECNVNHETTKSGAVLRTYKSEGEVTINRIGEGNGGEDKANGGTPEQGLFGAEGAKVRFLREE